MESRQGAGNDDDDDERASCLGPSGFARKRRSSYHTIRRRSFDLDPDAIYVKVGLASTACFVKLD